jgi:hypothetical protein
MHALRLANVAAGSMRLRIGRSGAILGTCIL